MAIPYDGQITDELGSRLPVPTPRNSISAGILREHLVAGAQEDFVQNVRNLQLTGLVLAIGAAAAFIPAVWFFGGSMSRSLRGITAQARKLQRLDPPDRTPVGSYLS